MLSGKFLLLESSLIAKTNKSYRILTLVDLSNYTKFKVFADSSFDKPVNFEYFFSFSFTVNNFCLSMRVVGCD